MGSQKSIPTGRERIMLTSKDNQWSPDIITTLAGFAGQILAPNFLPNGFRFDNFHSWNNLSRNILAHFSDHRNCYSVPF
jgi:hypothetical protein